MANTTTPREHRRKYMLLTAVTFVILLLFLIFLTEWFWIPLAFFLTYLVLALDVI